VIDRILAAVDDSAAGLAAARVAVDLAATYQASLRFVHVLADGTVTAVLDRSGGGGRLTERRGLAAASLLQHVADLARHAGVDADTLQTDGDPAQRILDESRSWPAGLIVMGRSDRHGPGQPYVGSQTRHVLEFAEQPVLVVPQVTHREVAGPRIQDFGSRGRSD